MLNSRMKTIIRILMLLSVFSWACRTPKPKPVVPRVIEPCDSFDSRVDEIWNDEVLEELGLTIKIYNGELGALDAEQIVTQMNSFSKEWVTLRNSACKNHNEPDSLSDDQYRRIVDCLDKALSDLEGRITEFKGGDVTALDSIKTELSLTTLCQLVFD